MMQSSVTAVCH